jgi:hypothetical protein
MSYNRTKEKAFFIFENQRKRLLLAGQLALPIAALFAGAAIYIKHPRHHALI